ncbi:unnamed protein product [Paramecium primaurelia]|uniref:ABC transporter domain-containing protein n=1 Tax=Paramecium primaurelia TaxID=5886 RepID=A0A8S1M3F4_PARPR|nr:unnamed protein product [Paramecium primaurelia]
MQVYDISHAVNDTVVSAKSVYHQKAIDLSFRNINYNIQSNRGERREILKDLDGFIPGGEVTAILGSSGAGKTSLLNILACRIAQTHHVRLTGKVMANLNEYSPETFSSFAAYVMQNDVLFETLTPREAFQFVANLKFVSEDEKNHHVDEVIKTMKLERCQNTMIGGLTLKGISGGERKRTSIGFELVTNPSCILLDEPTSGLDSFTAFQIINELRNLAHRLQKTIAFTIHQPSSDIFMLFDRVMLLVQGRFIYQGSRSQLVDYFKMIGFECPQRTNPMDYMMSIMHTEKEQNIKNFEILFDSYEKFQKPEVLECIEKSSRVDLTYKKVETSTNYQIMLITKRSIKGLLREKATLRQRFGSTIFMGLLVGGAFYGLGDNNGSYSDYSGVAGCLFLLTMNLTMTFLFSVVLQFATERDVFLREENSKLYTTFSYFIGKSFVEIPFCLITPVIQELILYWMIGLNTHSVGVVFIHLLVAILTSLNGNSIGLITGCVFSDIKAATSMVSILLLPFIIFSGYLANSKYFYVWISWIQYISPMKYSFEAFATNEFEKRQYVFGDPIETLGFDIGLWESIGILIALAIFIRIMAFIFLYKLRSRLQ